VGSGTPGIFVLGLGSVIRELTSMTEFYEAVTQPTGFIVIVDSARSPQIAHPPYCSSVQSEHFHEKVVRNGGRSGRYYWTSTFSEAAERFDAVRCSCSF